MRNYGILWAVSLAAVGITSAVRAESVGAYSVHESSGGVGFWQWTHQAEGNGTANVFDGGPPVFDEDVASDPFDDSVDFLARDHTQPGSFGAAARAAGGSRIQEDTRSTLLLFHVDFVVGYIPSSFPGGDNPGGSASGELSSVFEFVMPVDHVNILYGLDISHTFPFPFNGSTYIHLENVTQSHTLFELTSEIDDAELEVIANQGDVIRLTSNMSGSGSMGPGSYRIYAPDFMMGLFVIPEPATIILLGFGAAALARRWPVYHSLEDKFRK